MTERKQTEPGGFYGPVCARAPEGWHCTRGLGHPGPCAAQPAEQDEIPTRPDAVDPETLSLVRLFGDLGALDRKRAIRVLSAWSKCSLDRRVLIEALCRELQKGKT